MASKRSIKLFQSSNILELGLPGGVLEGRESGRAQNIMHALCAVIRPDHFKFASYGPEVVQPSLGSTSYMSYL